MRLPLHPLPAVLLLLASLPVTAQGVLSTLTLQVTDATGAPLAQVRVEVRGGGLAQPRMAMTDAQGEARLAMLPPGTYKVQVTKEGYIGHGASVPLGAGQERTLPLRLRKVAAASCVVEVVAVSMGLDKTETRTAPSIVSRSFSRPAPPPPLPPPPPGAETYRPRGENPFKRVKEAPLSTFSVDVDTAGYSNVRRFLMEGQQPPQDAIKLEELINYFPTQPLPVPADQPFAVATTLTECPWQPRHRLLRVHLQTARPDLGKLPPRNLVFLVDVSGSMAGTHKLPLVKAGLLNLTNTLRPEDRVAIVVYAGSSGLVLEPTSGADKGRIREALGRLEAGGSTAGAAGIQLAYEVALKHFREGADNRVLLCTDGDFNVGMSDEGSLVRLIEEKRRTGVFLTCLGFGMGNYKDATLEQLADKGNGHHAYIDSLEEMAKVFGDGGASLVTVAKDVKLQVEFNPAQVAGYRLLGYENRILADQDFNDDAKDAGEINAGHCVTALYELIMAGGALPGPGVDALVYQQPARPLARPSGDLLTLKVRYKKPDGWFSRRLSHAVPATHVPLAQASPDTRWAAAVASFGLALRGSEHRGQATLDLAEALARGADPCAEGTLQGEFMDLIRRARRLGP